MGIHTSPRNHRLHINMAAVSPPTTTAPRYFGRFELRQMLGRSHASGIWLAVDPRLQQEVLLCVPRAQPQKGKELDAWTQEVLAGARLKHPCLTEVLEVSAHEGWPFVSYARGQSVSLFERVSSGPQLTPLEVVVILCDVLDGLAYAHEAGVAHQDIALHSILIDKSGHAAIAGLSCGLAPLAPDVGSVTYGAGGSTRERTHRTVKRILAETALLPAARAWASRWAIWMIDDSSRRCAVASAAAVNTTNRSNVRAYPAGRSPSCRRSNESGSSGTPRR